MLNRIVMAVAAVVMALTGITASAQAMQAESHPLATPPKSKSVPLASDLCPKVSVGDSVSLDWNPGFEHEGIVTGLHAFSLRFNRLGDNGVALLAKPSLSLGSKSSAFNFTATGNGFYHIELLVPKGYVPGIYRLVDAHSTAAVLPGFQGEPPHMNVSPVRERYCITIVSQAPPQ